MTKSVLYMIMSNCVFSRQNSTLIDFPEVENFPRNYICLPFQIHALWLLQAAASCHLFMFLPTPAFYARTIPSEGNPNSSLLSVYCFHCELLVPNFSITDQLTLNPSCFWPLLFLALPRSLTLLFNTVFHSNKIQVFLPITSPLIP